MHMLLLMPSCRHTLHFGASCGRPLVGDQPPSMPTHICPHCGVAFPTKQGMHVHVGMSHGQESHLWPKGDSVRRRKRRRQAPQPEAEHPPPPPPPPPFPAPFLVHLDEDGGVDEAANMEEDAPAGAPADAPAGAVAEARAEARRLLRAPGVERWAEDTLAWCEEHILHDVGAIFPTAEDFPTKETYRFLRLVHSHPGAALPGELLKANQEEHLDLDKVRIWGGMGYEGRFACISDMP